MNKQILIVTIILTYNLLISDKNSKPNKVKEVLKIKNQEKKIKAEGDFISKDQICQNTKNPLTQDQVRFDIIKQKDEDSDISQIERDQLSSMAPSEMWRVRENNEFYKKLRDYSQKEEYLTMALIPQMAICREGYMEQTPRQCDCTIEPRDKKKKNNGHQNKKMNECISQKATFTAGLLITRMFCGRLDSLAGKYHQSIINKDQRQHKIDGLKNHLITQSEAMNLTIMARGLIDKCRTTIQGLGKIKDDLKYQMYNWCQDVIQQCKNFSIQDRSDVDVSKANQIIVNCDLTDVEMNDKQGLFVKIQDLEFKQQFVKTVGSVLTLSALVTFHLVAAPVAVPIAAGLIIAGTTLAVDRHMEIKINALKGKTTHYFDLSILMYIMQVALAKISNVEALHEVQHLGHMTHQGLEVVEAQFNATEMHEHIEEHGHHQQVNNVVDGKHEGKQLHLLTKTMMHVIGAVVEVLNKDRRYRDNFILDNQMVHQLGRNHHGQNDEEKVGQANVLTELLNKRERHPSLNEQREDI